MVNSKSKLKLIFFHSSLVGFCEFVREQIEATEDDKGLDEIMKHLILGAKSELIDIKVNLSKKELKRLEAEHKAFFDKHIEGGSYLAGFNFYLAKIEDFLGSVSADKRKHSATINPKRTARLEQMQGLLTTALAILTVEYEKHLGLTETQAEDEAEKAGTIIENFESMFERKAA